MLPRDGRPGPSDPQQPEEEEEEAVREYIAVLDADSSPMAEQVGATSAGQCIYAVHWEFSSP